MISELTAEEIVPVDRYNGTLVGRIWIGSDRPGPRTAVAREDGLFDLSGLAPTLSDLFDLPDLANRVRRYTGERLCSLDDAFTRHAILAPCDLQAIKAAGVTFADSLIERVIEERAKGDLTAAA